MFEQRKQKAIKQLKELLSKFDFKSVCLYKIKNRCIFSEYEMKKNIAKKMLSDICVALKWVPWRISLEWEIEWFSYTIHFNTAWEIDINLCFMICNESSYWISKRYDYEISEYDIKYVLWE